MGRYDQSVALHRRASVRLAGGVNSSFRAGGLPVPLYVLRGEGARLHDVDGNCYIDYAQGLGPTILGHAPARVLARVAEILALGQTYAASHTAEVELAERLAAIVPCAEMVRFASSGSEAVHIALRLARAHTGRPKIVKFEGHYHGWLDNILVSTKPALNAAGPADAPVAVIQSAGQPDSAADGLIVQQWNDLEALAATLRARAGEIAAVIMEPIMCNTGAILPRPGFLEGVRALCSELGILLIFDEVVTGFRVGLSGAQGRLGVTPDLAIFAKAIAAGFPLSCVAGRRDVLERLHGGNVLHGGTYNANVLSVVAALEVLEVLGAEDGAAFLRMEETGVALRDGLAALLRDRGVPAVVQGLGSVFNLSFTDQTELRNYRDMARTDAALLADFVNALQDRGVRLTARGTFLMSTAHGAADVEETLAAAGQALDALRL